MERMTRFSHDLVFGLLGWDTAIVYLLTGYRNLEVASWDSLGLGPWQLLFTFSFSMLWTLWLSFCHLEGLCIYAVPLTRMPPFFFCHICLVNFYFSDFNSDITCSEKLSLTSQVRSGLPVAMFLKLWAASL